VIEGVLFDLDGTLFDHRGAAEKAVWQLADRFEPVIAREDVLVAWFSSEERHMAEYLRDECTFAEQRCRRVQDVAPLLGLDLTKAEMEEWFTTNYLSGYEAAWRCFPDAVESLRWLKDGQPPLVTGVITNGDSPQQHLKAERIGLRHLLGPILTPAELGVAKPDPSSFHAACRRLGLTPGRTVYVGDSLEIDALGASRAGLIGVWLDRASSETRDARDEDSLSQPIRITDLTELPSLIRSLSA
jgi:putative hydrolase of the HAD superfamily